MGWQGVRFRGSDQCDRTSKDTIREFGRNRLISISRVLHASTFISLQLKIAANLDVQQILRCEEEQFLTLFQIVLPAQIRRR